MAKDNAKPQTELSPAVPATSTVTAEAPVEAVETLYHVGLKADAPMEIVDIPTGLDMKAVSVPKFTRELSESENNPDIAVLGEARIRGRHEALFPQEYAGFRRYVKSHAFLIDTTKKKEVRKGEWKEFKMGRIAPVEGTGAVKRNLRDQIKRTEPLADYIWIIPATDRSRYPGDPPTISEMEKAGK